MSIARLKTWTAGEVLTASDLNAEFNRMLQQQFPSGTRMLFQQSSAPTGWTQESGAAYSNAGLRIITMGTASTGGTRNFTDVITDNYASDSGGAGTSGSATTGITVDNTDLGLSVDNTNLGLSVAGTAITQAQLPANITGDLNSIDSLGRWGSVTGVFSSTASAVSRPSGSSALSSIRNVRFSLGGSGQTHTHSLNGSSGNHAHTLSGSAGAHAHTVSDAGHTHTTPDHSHTVDLAIKYVDFIVCQYT